MSDRDPGPQGREGQAGQGRLTRTREDRMLAGVAGGLGEHFSVDPIVFRIAFAITTLIGGIGLVAYLALYVLLPASDSAGEPVHADDRSRLIAALAAFLLLAALSGGPSPFWGLGAWWGFTWLAFWAAVLAAVAYAALSLWRRPGGSDARPGGDDRQRDAGNRTTGRVLGLTLLALALAALAATVAVLGAWLAAAGGIAVLAAAAAVAAGLVMIATLHRPSRWLIVPALALGLGLLAVEASGIELRGGYGDRHITPVATASIPEGGYSLAAGDLTVDLRSLDWDRGRSVRLEVSMGIGRASVVVPERVCVSATGEAKAGEIAIRGDSQAGVGLDSSVETVPGASPILELEGSVEVGVLQVVTRPPQDGAGDRSRPGYEEPPQPRECFQPAG